MNSTEGQPSAGPHLSVSFLPLSAPQGCQLPLWLFPLRIKIPEKRDGGLFSSTWGLMRGKTNTGVSQEEALPQVGRGLPARASGVLASLPVMFGATSELLHHFRLEGMLWGDARYALNPDPLIAFMRPLFHLPLRVHSSYTCFWPSELQKLVGIPGPQGAPARGSRFQVAGGKCRSSSQRPQPLPFLPLKVGVGRQRTWSCAQASGSEAGEEVSGGHSPPFPRADGPPNQGLAPTQPLLNPRSSNPPTPEASPMGGAGPQVGGPPMCGNSEERGPPAAEPALPPPSCEFQIRDQSNSRKTPSCFSLKGDPSTQRRGWEDLAHPTAQPNMSSESQLGPPCKKQAQGKTNTEHRRWTFTDLGFIPGNGRISKTTTMHHQGNCRACGCRGIEGR